MKKVFAAACALCMLLLSFGFAACGGEKRYALSVTGGNYLYESLQDTYRAGEEVTVKTKIIPYEGVKVSLDTQTLAKSKSSQNEYWQFTFEMPAHDAVLDVSYFKGFDEPLLSGFYITFADRNGDPIEALNGDVKSKDAIADYLISYYDEEHDCNVFSNNEGANVFAECKQKAGDNAFELEDTLYYTYELLDAVAWLEWVYLDEDTQEVFTDRNAGFKLGGVGISSTTNRQNLSDIRYTEQMKEYEEKFDSCVKINFQYLDYLTGVKVLEYSADNRLIKSADIDKSENEITHVASEECEYVVIEEEYTAMDGEERQGEKHCERTLINKSELGGGKVLKYPRGDGLISPVYLSVVWQGEAEG